MEVASPLTIAHAAAGTKRSLACSPGLMDNPFVTSSMEISDENNNNMQRAFKRRRFLPDSAMAETNDGPTDFPSFMTAAINKNKSIFSSAITASSSNGPSFKRCRQDALSPVQSQGDLERLVETQSNEIECLKSAKANLETSLASLKSEHEKTLNENRILKRAVTIQQERQTQASNDLEAARHFKVNAEDNIRRLEQMIFSLRYHLQAQQTPGNDFMGFQPPDVY
ncbi:expressed unknown protein [Seminavis robusta]|uniref:Uncharacterized protein n=1 Tax=Seminavis robusta TaxID=568900 RepID=A0A9N8HJD3_9STRA|nr:expressed unknown protein [Seminavis robusta]|eukprot:Sro759_g198150.1 n/a (225) ;mRNA; f:7149-7998